MSSSLLLFSLFRNLKYYYIIPTHLEDEKGKEEFTFFSMSSSLVTALLKLLPALTGCEEQGAAALVFAIYFRCQPTDKQLFLPIFPWWLSSACPYKTNKKLPVPICFSSYNPMSNLSSFKALIPTRFPTENHLSFLVYFGKFLFGLSWMVTVLLTIS